MKPRIKRNLRRVILFVVGTYAATDPIVRGLAALLGGPEIDPQRAAIYASVLGIVIVLYVIRELVSIDDEYRLEEIKAERSKADELIGEIAERDKDHQ